MSTDLNSLHPMQDAVTSFLDLTKGATATGLQIETALLISSREVLLGSRNFSDQIGSVKKDLCRSLILYLGTQIRSSSKATPFIKELAQAIFSEEVLVELLLMDRDLKSHVRGLNMPIRHAISLLLISLVYQKDRKMSYRWFQDCFGPVIDAVLDAVPAPTVGPEAGSFEMDVPAHIVSDCASSIDKVDTTKCTRTITRVIREITERNASMDEDLWGVQQSSQNADETVGSLSFISASEWSKQGQAPQEDPLLEDRLLYTKEQDQDQAKQVEAVQKCQGVEESSQVGEEETNQGEQVEEEGEKEKNERGVPKCKGRPESQC